MRVTIEQQRDARQFRQCTNRQCGARDTVYLAAQFVGVGQPQTAELIGKGWVFHFPPTRFSIHQHTDIGERLTFHDQTGRDGLFLADFLQNPDRARVALPISDS